MGEKLSLNEAVCLVLNLAKNNKINSTTTLQKSVARLQKYLILLEFEFLLNKYGSDSPELRSQDGNEFFSKEPYDYTGGTGYSFLIKEKGFELAKSAEEKIKSFISEDEFKDLKNEIISLSSMSAAEASDNEHSLLLVDLKNREKLIFKINSVNIDLYDLYEKLNDTNEHNLTYNALVEYLYNLSKFLKEKRFKNIDDKGYTYEKEMYDYYLLLNLEESLKSIQNSPSEEWLEKTYNKFIEFGKVNHVFSIENPDLMRLI